MVREALVARALLFAFILAIAACTTPQPLVPTSTHAALATATIQPTATLPPTVASLPKVISHPRPHLSTSPQGLSEAGCSPFDDHIKGTWYCRNSPAIWGLGCEGVAPEDLLAGFLPSYPVMRCLNWTGQSPDPEHYRFSSNYGLYTYDSFIIFQNGVYRLIAKESELQATFAPIESAEEALSYALVATDLIANYKIKEANLKNFGPHFYLDTLEATHVDETPEGFIVHLFTNPTPPDGCETHITYAVDVLVTHDGRVEEISTRPAFGDDACIN